MLAINNSVTLPLSTSIALAFLMGLLAFAIMLGNAIVAFIVDKNLRHRSNYYIFKLAFSDFFVGLISIPLNTPQTLFNWNFENKICIFWHLLCTASVYNIVLISYDGYQSVSNAVSYRAQYTGIWKIVALMVAIWELAFLVHGPIIIISESKTKKQTCEAGFFEKYVLAIRSFLEFLVPVFLVDYFNIYIYWGLMCGHLYSCQSHPGLTSVSSNSGHVVKCGLFSRASLAKSKEATAPSPGFKREGRKSSLLLSLRTEKNSDVIASKTGSLSCSDNLDLHQKEHLELLRARKLAKSLAILFVVFTICWAPYSLFTFVLSTYSNDQHPKTILYEITFWLQWCNSLISSILHPFYHKHFQKAFSKIFCTKE
ncbi:LOW QUALITY PROTEIN: histamine H4 receptor [Rhynchonycteris naso]